MAITSRCPHRCDNLDLSRAPSWALAKPPPPGRPSVVHTVQDTREIPQTDGMVGEGRRALDPPRKRPRTRWSRLETPAPPGGTLPTPRSVSLGRVSPFGRRGHGGPGRREDVSRVAVSTAVIRDTVAVTTWIHSLVGLQAWNPQSEGVSGVKSILWCWALPPASAPSILLPHLHQRTPVMTPAPLGPHRAISVPISRPSTGLTSASALQALCPQVCSHAGGIFGGWGPPQPLPPLCLHRGCRSSPASGSACPISPVGPASGRLS